MAVLLRPWNSQPQFPAAPAPEFRSVTTLASHNFANTGTTRNARKSGIVHTSNGSSTYLNRSIAVGAAPGKFVAAYFRRTATAGISAVIYSLGENAATGSLIALRGSDTNGGISLLYRATAAGAFFEVGSATSTIIPLNTDVCVVGVLPSYSSAEAYVYVNGIKYNTVIAAGAPSGNATLTFETIGADRRNAVSLYYPADVYAVGHGGAIAEHRARYLSQNPWEMFAPQQRRIWVPVQNFSASLTGNLISGQTGIVSPEIKVDTVGNAGSFTSGAIGIGGSLILLSSNSASFVQGLLPPSISKALTSNLLSTSVGQLPPNVSLAITGNTASLFAGQPTENISIGATGNIINSTQGSLGVGGSSVLLTGNLLVTSVGAISIGLTRSLVAPTAASFAQGSFSSTLALSLTSNQSIFAPGSLTASVPGALTGNVVVSSVGQPIASVALALTGNIANTSNGTTFIGLTTALTSPAVLFASSGIASPSVSVQLTGNNVLFSSGIVLVPATIVLNSNLVTLLQGSVAPRLGVTLTGNSISTSVGTVSRVIQLALSGLAGTSSAGILIPGLRTNIAGNSTSTGVGVIQIATGSSSIPLAGNSAAFYAGLLVYQREPQLYPLAGQTQDFALDGSSQTYPLAAVEQTYPSVGASQSYPLAGASQTYPLQ